MGAIRKLFGGILKMFDGVRKVLHFIVLIFMFSLLAAMFSGEPPPRMPGKAALLIDPEGPLVDQLSGDPVDRAFSELQGNARPAALVRDLVAAIEHAANDSAINALVLRLDSLGGAGLTKLQAVANAIVVFRQSGKKVYAYGDFYTQNQYFLAAYADEIYLHESGGVFIDGYGRYRTFYKDAIDKLSIDWNIFKVGEYKSFVEPFFRNDMSPEDRTSSLVWLSQLWGSYQTEVAAARGLAPNAIQSYTASMLAGAQANGGDIAQLAVDAGLVNALWPRDRFEDHVAKVVGRDKTRGAFNQIAYDDYAKARQLGSKKHGTGAPIGVIVASGQILDGEQPQGTIGGDTLARLIRKAREDKTLRALILKIDSGGGSKFASEIIQRELQLWKQTQRPLVAVMSSVAASGGYWIAMDADEIWASPNTITGSIGIGGYFPTFQRTLGRLGINVDGVGTTRWSGEFRPDRSLGDEAGALLQKSMEHGYQQFITAVAEARNMSTEAVDKIARGRVWSGLDAQRLGLVDRLGTMQEAAASAASLAGIADDYHLRYIEKDLSVKEQVALMFAARADTWFGEELSGLRRQNEWQRLGDSLGLTRLQEELRALTRFNDPQGVYAYCFCRLE